MRAGRDAMQDVEIVEVDGDAVDPADAADAAGRADRAAARRASAGRVLRRLRRWWPVPLALVAALVAVQVVQDRRGEAAVERRRQVEGVLPEIDPDLRAREITDDTDLWTSLTAMDADGLEISVPAVGVEDERVVAGSRDGDEIWRTSVEDLTPQISEHTSSSPECALDSSTARVVCQVDDRAPVTSDLGVWLNDSVVASRLVVLDTATGRVLDRRTLPVGARTVVDGDRVYVVSVADGELQVESRDVATGSVRWRAGLVPDDGLDLGEDDVPWPAVAGDYLLVGLYQSTWAFDLADGALAASSNAGLAVGRTGLLLETGMALRRAEDGSLVTDVATRLVTPQVDDGSVGDLELVTRVDGTDDAMLAAVDGATGDTAWTADLGSWDGYSVIVLDGTVYGCGTAEIWAIDLASGRRTWTAAREQGIDGSLITDGRHLFTTERAGQAMAVTADGARSDASAGDGAVLVGHRLSDGVRDWEAPLPEGVDAVSAFDDRLLGYSSTGRSTTVLLD